MRGKEGLGWDYQKGVWGNSGKTLRREELGKIGDWSRNLLGKGIRTRKYKYLRYS